MSPSPTTFPSASIDTCPETYIVRPTGASVPSENAPPRIGAGNAGLVITRLDITTSLSRFSDYVSIAFRSSPDRLRRAKVFYGGRAYAAHVRRPGRPRTVPGAGQNLQRPGCRVFRRARRLPGSTAGHRRHSRQREGCEGALGPRRSRNPDPRPG